VDRDQYSDGPIEFATLIALARGDRLRKQRRCHPVRSCGHGKTITLVARENCPSAEHHDHGPGANVSRSTVAMRPGYFRSKRVHRQHLGLTITNGFVSGAGAEVQGGGSDNGKLNLTAWALTPMPRKQPTRVPSPTRLSGGLLNNNGSTALIGNCTSISTVWRRAEAWGGEWRAAARA